MKSQIHENADGLPSIDRILDDADARIARLAQDRMAISERQRALIEPTFKTVVANPTEMHHKIALGAVMVSTGLAAADADALAGVLALNADQVVADCDDLIAANPSATFGQILIAMIDLYGRDLGARGLFETWRRRLADYNADRAEWLARDVELRLEGAWRGAAMTKNQQWLVRVTCRIRRIDLPGDLSRGDASDWISANGGNVNYREFV